MMYQKVNCDHVQLTASDMWGGYHFLRNNAEIRAVIDDMTRNLVVELVTSMPAILSDRIVVHEKWPLNWYEALKERWAPLWFIKRWPVQYFSLDIDRPTYAAVCPHLNEVARGPHVQFLCQCQPSIAPVTE